MMVEMKIAISIPRALTLAIAEAIEEITGIKGATEDDEADMLNKAYDIADDIRAAISNQIVPA